MQEPGGGLSGSGVRPAGDAESDSARLEAEGEQEPLALGEDMLLGLWNDMPGVAAGYGETYRFFADGQYRFGYSEMDGLERRISEAGTWRLEGDTLVLTVTR